MKTARAVSRSLWSLVAWWAISTCSPTVSCHFFRLPWTKLPKMSSHMLKHVVFVAIFLFPFGRRCTEFNNRLVGIGFVFPAKNHGLVYQGWKRWHEAYMKRHHSTIGFTGVGYIAVQFLNLCSLVASSQHGGPVCRVCLLATTTTGFCTFILQ